MTKKKALKSVAKSAPVGRPSKYRPEYCQQLHEALKEGLTYEAFGGRIGVCRDTLYEWESKHPEFSDARKVGRGLSEAYYIGLLQGIARGDFGEARTNAAAAIFLAKNVCGMRDQREVAHGGPDGKPLEITQVVLTAEERAERNRELDRLAASRRECGHD